MSDETYVIQYVCNPSRSSSVISASSFVQIWEQTMSCRIILLGAEITWIICYAHEAVETDKYWHTIPIHITREYVKSSNRRDEWIVTQTIDFRSEGTDNIHRDCDTIESMSQDQYDISTSERVRHKLSSRVSTLRTKINDELERSVNEMCRAARLLRDIHVRIRPETVTSKIARRWDDVRRKYLITFCRDFKIGHKRLAIYL